MIDYSAKIISPPDWSMLEIGGKITLRSSQPASFIIALKRASKADGDTDEFLYPRLVRDEKTVTAIIERHISPGAYVAHAIDEATGGTIHTSGVHVSDETRTPQFIAQTAWEWRDQMIPAFASSQSATPLFSITTTAYDTSPEYLFALCDCVTGQTFDDFEWLLLDNGSAAPATINALKTITEKNPRFRYFRVEHNVHIIPGNRYLLERANGRYILPVDSDDLLSNDALERMARYISYSGFPEIAYSDEVKMTGEGEPAEAIRRAPPSYLSALSTCPAAHLMALDRKSMTPAAYSDSYAQGSHDWDSFLRLMDGGARAIHIPEALYGWRMHEQSSAASDASKDYLLSSQIAVVENSLKRRKLDKSFTVERADEILSLGFFYMRRNALDLPPVDIFLLGDGEGADDVASHASQYQGGAFVTNCESYTQLNEALRSSAAYCSFVIDASLKPAREDWIAETVGTFELGDGVKIVGGCITDDASLIQNRRVNHAAYFLCANAASVTAFGNFDSMYMIKGARALLRRNVSAVYAGLMAFRHGAATPVTGMAQGPAICFAAGAGSSAYCPRFQFIGDLQPHAEMNPDMPELNVGSWTEAVKNNS